MIPKSEDGSIKGTQLESWGPIAWECGDKFGKSFKIAEESREIMENAGFVNVERRTFKWPIGPWTADRKLKEIGAYNRLGWDEGIKSVMIVLLSSFSAPLQYIHFPTVDSFVYFWHYNNMKY